MDKHILEEHEGVSIEGEDYDPMEDDNHAPKNTFEDDGANALIHDTFITAGDGGGGGDDDDDNGDDIEVIHDIPLHENQTHSFTKDPNQLFFSLLYCCW